MNRRISTPLPALVLSLLSAALSCSESPKSSTEPQAPARSESAAAPTSTPPVGQAQAAPPAVAGSAQDPGSTPNPGAAPDLAGTFSWPADARARVTETATKNGQTTVIRYSMQLTDSDEPDERLVQLRDFEIVDIAGTDMNEPALLHSMAPALAIMQTVPDFRVGAHGEFLGSKAIELNEMIERVAHKLEKLEAGTGMSPPEFREAMGTPQMRQLLAVMSADAWNCWAANWGGLSLTPGATLVEEVSIPMQAGMVPARVVLENLGPAEGAPDKLRMAVSMRLVGAQLGEVVADFLQTMSSKLSAPRDGMDGLAPLQLTFESRSGALLSADDRRPTTAFYEKRISQTGAEEGAPARLERHEYSFEWQ